MDLNLPTHKKIDDCYRIVGQSEPTLLELMDDIAGAEQIEFNPPRLNFQSQPVGPDVCTTITACQQALSVCLELETGSATQSTTLVNPWVA